MPDTGTPYLDSGLQTGLSNTDLLSMKLETMNNFDRLINQEVNTQGKFDFFNPETDQRISDTDKAIQDINTGQSDFTDYLTHPDSRIRDAANSIIFNKIGNDPYFKNNVGGTNVYPYDKSMEKFLGKDYGFRFDRDNEDYYYRNVYMQDNWFLRNIIKNPLKFIGRVIPQAILKFGEGLGYVGSMLTSIGSDNYWANVADNGFSNWLNNVEQDYKDKVIPVYKQAGFDEKGFFSKLVDWSFWNDEIADAVAFMASAAAPAGVLGKIGKVGQLAGEANAFGRTFGALSEAGSIASRAGKFASKIGLGSWAELSSWAFNTGMEASMEGSQVFKTLTDKLRNERAQGVNNYSDAEIKEIAGKKAANDIAANFGILSVSNAFENTLFFKPFKNIEGRAAIQLDEGLNASARALDKFGGLSRPVFYGKLAAEGTFFEGLWEENAQLATQRVNQGDSDGRGFWSQLGHQTLAAFSGNDKEAAENIGLGALIGILAPVAFSKASGERRQIVQNTKTAIEDARVARQNLLTHNDVYERDADNNIIFDATTKEAKVDNGKLLAKQKAYEKVAEGISFASKEDYFGNSAVQFKTQKALADYVRSLYSIGVDDISGKFASLKPETATIFGLNPSKINEQAKEFGTLAREFEGHARNVDELPVMKLPADISRKDGLSLDTRRRADIYDARTDNTILNRFIADETSKLLDNLNSFRKLNNTSLAQFPVDQLNGLIYQKKLNEQVMKHKDFADNMSDLEKEYHVNKDTELTQQIEDYKKDNDILLTDSKVTPSGFYTPTITDTEGNKRSVPFDTKSATSQRRIADYQNTIDKNNYIDSLLTSDTAYDNYQKLLDTPMMKKLKEVLAKPESVPTKYRELQPGDFDKITALVRKMVFGTNQQYSPEDLQLQHNYPKLIEEIVPQYQEVAENNRVVVLTARLKSLTDQQKLIGNQVRAYRSRLQDKKTELEILKEEIQMVANGGKANQKRLSAAIDKLELDIQEVESWVSKQQKRLGDLETQIDILTQEVESGNLTGLRNSLEELGRERMWLRKKVTDTQSLIDRLKKLVADLRRLAYKLFGGKANFERNLEKGRYEAVGYAGEVQSNKTALEDARQLLTDLTSLQAEMDSIYQSNKAELQGIIDETDKYFKDKYLDLTKAPAKQVATDADEDAITKGLTGDAALFPKGNESKGDTYDPEAGFDGATYQRPLSTKFFTTTFPDYSGQPLSSLPKDVQDHFALMEYLTNPANTADIKTKLGKGKLVTLVVTRNNVNELGLQDALKERAQYFTIEDAATTHIEVIPVIEEGGYMYYVDTELNRLGRVKEKAPTNMVRRSLRTAKFTPVEQTQYAAKYTPEDMAKAVSAATDWRKEILDITASAPDHHLDFTITRGIPNKQKMADSGYATNPVVGNLISAAQVNGQTVRVYSDPNIIVNDENIVVPSGRPFIFTTNGIHEQLHAADNQKLTSEQVKTVSYVMDAMLTDHLKKVEDRIERSTTFPKALKDKITAVGGVANLDAQTKQQVYLKITSDPSTKGFLLLNTNYTNFLSSIVYFALRTKEQPGTNQIYFKGPRLVFGDSGISIDITESNPVRGNGDVQAWLSNQFHNIKYFTKPDRANAAYTEYYTDGDTIKSRQWKNYSEYLLSETLPDGGKRSVIPVTTAIKTKEQQALENNNDPYYPYLSRAMTIITDAAPITKKPMAKKGTVASNLQAAPQQTPEQMAEAIEAGFLAAYNVPADNTVPAPKRPSAKIAQEKSVVESAEEIALRIEAGFMAAYPIKTGTEEVKPAEREPDNEVPDYNEGNNLPPLPAEDENYRIAKGGVFETEQDLNATVADIKRMLPQFPVFVERLRSVIKTSDGVEAFGQFVDNTIRLAQFGEVGTGYHEVFEAVANRLLSNVEWRAMEKEFRARPGYFTDRETDERLRYADASSQQVKEELAEEFRDYKLNKKSPSQKNTNFFFKLIKDFINWLFGSQSIIRDIFDKIEKGKFAKSPIRAADRFKSNYRLKGIPIQAKRDLFDGATSFMFSNIFYSPESLTKLDEIDLNDEQVYEPIRAQFRDTLTGMESRATAATDEKYKRDYSLSAKYIKYALDNWKEFVSEHKLQIRRFAVKFEEADDRSGEQRESQNRNDYAQEMFKIPGKKSAAKSVRFLFGSLIKMKSSDLGEVKTVNDRTTAKITHEPSSVYMRSLVNYDDYMLRALEELSGLGDFSKVEQKLAEMAGISDIEAMINPEEQKKVVAGLTEEKAVWTLLYQRLFGFSDKIDEEAAWNLRVKVNNYIAKQAPEPYVMLDGGGSTSIVSSTKRGFFEMSIKRMETAINANKNTFFNRKRVGNDYLYVAKIKTQMAAGQFIPKMKNFIEFIGMQEFISPAFINSLTQSKKAKLVYHLLRLRNELTKLESPNLTFKQLDISKYTENLIKFLDEQLPVSVKEGSYLSIINELNQRYVLPSFISRLMDEVNNSQTIEEFQEKFPQTATYFAQDSIMMSRLFDEDGNRTDYQIGGLRYAEGIKDTEENEGTKSSQLELSDRYFHQFNYSLNGVYFSLPADSETEWAFNFGEFVPYSSNLLENMGDTIIKEIFLPKLKSEIDAVINDDGKLAELQKVHKSTGKTAGKSLRFFKDILQYTAQGKTSMALVNEVQKAIDDGTKSEKIISNVKLRNKIVKAIGFYLSNEVEEAKKTLIDNRTMNEIEGEFFIKGINNTFLDKYSLPTDSGVLKMTEVQMYSLLQYQKVNSVIGEMEIFKMVFGDPAQYASWEKRAKSFFSPVEQTYYDKEGKLNKFLNENKNSAILGDEKVDLGADDWFRTDFSDSFTARTIDDFIVSDITTLNDLLALNSDYANKYLSAYEKTNEADGQSIGSIGFARHLMLKSGWRWTQEMEDYYQYDTALMRQELSALPSADPHHYDYKGNNALKAIDKKIVESYGDNAPTTSISPLKTLMPSVSKDGNITLLKHSIHFPSYQVAKGFELLDTYIDMLKRGDSLLNFASAHKVGIEVDNDGNITPYYQDPFTKNDLEQKGNPQYQMDMRTIGIQVETQTSGKKQTLGSQVTADINLNLMPNGIPTDFKGEGVTESQIFEEWNSMTHEEKLEQSENYSKIYGEQGTFTTLENLKTKNALDTFTRLGVGWNFNGDNITYKVEDLSKVKDFIIDELTRLEVDENTVDNIELNEAKNAFLNPAETIPSYTTIANLLWSMADKASASMKVNGKMYIQVSSAFFNKGKREAAYFDGETNKWTVVDNKTDYDRLVAEGKKMVMTSTDLKFYRKGENSETLGMEIYLPHIYKRKVNDKRVANGLPRLSDQELMEHLNSDPRLLEGIGFRIPTQDTASIDFFTIKGFLPEAFGSAVVVPSAITTKTGSDFDVDKLNTYLNNFKMDGKGLPYYEEFKDNNNSTLNDRYTAFIKSHEKDFRVIANDMKASQEFKDVEARMEENEDLLEGERDVIGIAKDEEKEVYDEGLEIFSGLPLSIKQQYYERERNLRASDISGAEKTLSYIEFTRDWIKEFTGENGAIAGSRTLAVTIRRKGEKPLETTETVYPEQVIPVFNEMLDNYEQFLAKMGITKEIINDYYELKKERKDENSQGMRNFFVRVAKIIAEFNGYPSIDDFGKYPTYLQNTSGALQNRYFQSLRNVLKSPEMFEYLLAPTSPDHIRSMRDEVYSALGKEVEDKQEINYASLLSTETLARKRHEVISAKADIGIGAVGMKNYALSQVSGIGIGAEGGIDAMDSYVFDTLNDSEISLPFKDIQVLNVYGKDFIPISNLKDSSGAFVMNKISSYITGYVDAPKDAALSQAGVHRELAGTYLLLERMGLTGKTTALFLYQPSIREFLKEILFLDRKTYFGQAIDRSQKKIIEQLANKYGYNPTTQKMLDYDPNYTFSDNQLRDLISKGEMVKQGKANWTLDEKKAQYYALVNFLKVKMFSQHLLASIQGSNHDTAGIRSPWIIVRKDLGMEKTKKGNTVVKITDGKVSNGTEALRNETFIKTDVSILKGFNSVFSKMGLFALQKNNPQTALLAIAGRIFSQNPFMTGDDFISAMREYESSLIDLLGNKVLVPGVGQGGSVVYNELYKYAAQYFKTNSPTSLKKKFEYIKKRYPVTYKRNFFLNNLQFVSDPTLGIDLMELKRKPSNADVLTKERITEGMLQLATIDESTIAPEFKKYAQDINEFYRAIVYGAFIQNGIKFSRKSFVDLIPVSTTLDADTPLALTDITKPALEKIDSEDLSMLDEQVQRAKWWRKGIVPEKAQMSMHMLVPNEKGEYVLENRARWRQGDSKPPNLTKTSQVFFGVDKGDGEMIPSIHPAMIWAGYTDNPTKWEDMDTIIKIPAIKPEFLQGSYREVRGFDQPVYMISAKPVVFQMMSKGDYSYMFHQEYKKVGAENPAMARGMIGRADKQGRKSVSYLYKPINKQGSRDFNEMNPLIRTVQDTVIGSKSIINYPAFKELEDSELVSSINNVGNQLQMVFKQGTQSIDKPLKSRTANLKPVHRSTAPAAAVAGKITFEEEKIAGYRMRTIKNASADATIAIATNFRSAGEMLTKTSVISQKKQYIPIDANTLDVTPERIEEVISLLNKVSAKSLNIAGNGIYTMKGKYTQEQVDEFTYQLLKGVIESPVLINKITSIRTGGQTGFDEAGAKAGLRLGIPTSILAPKGWTFRNIEGKDIYNEVEFKARFASIKAAVPTDLLSQLREKAAELEKAEELQYFIDKAAEAPAQYYEKYGEVLTNQLLENVPTETLMKNFNFLVKGKGGEQSASADILMKIMDSREEGDSTLAPDDVPPIHPEC